MKKNITGRIGAVLLIVSLMVTCLAGCGGTNPEKAVQTAAEGMMSALQEGDFDKITEFASEDMVKEDGDLAFVESMKEITDSLMTSLGVDKDNISEDAVLSIEDFKGYVTSNFITSFEITDVKVEDGIGTVSCDYTYGFNTDYLDSSLIADELKEIVTTYTQDHLDELVTIRSEQGEDALVKALVDGVLPEMMTAWKNNLISSGEVASSCTMKVEQIDDKWIVTEAKLAD